MSASDKTTLSTSGDDDSRDTSKANDERQEEPGNEEKNEQAEASPGRRDREDETPSLLLRLLDHVERAGNRLPAPVTIFFIFAVLVLLGSWLASLLGVSASHPGTGETITSHNLLSHEGIYRLITEAVSNFTNFAPLGTVLVVMIGIGVAERSGLISTGLRQLMAWVPRSLVTATLVFAGIMSSMAADAGYVVLTPLGAVLFAGMGRHPIAGLAAAFAGVSAGYSANLFITSLDPLLAGFTTEAAAMLDPAYEVHAASNWYFMIVSVPLMTLVGTFVTTRLVEPHLGSWTPKDGDPTETPEAVTSTERWALLAAAGAFLLSLILVAFLVVPEGAILRDDQGGLGPFYGNMVPILLVVFFLPGLAYGLVARTITSDKAVEKMTADTMATMGAYIVLAFVAAQFVAYFSWSNLGLIMAVKGAELLQSLGMAGIGLILGFIFISAILNIFIGSASAKWGIMAPIFVPMLMTMGYSPELVQVAYRVGDSVTNIITPLLPYFPIISAFAKRYDENSGLGTLIAAMLPYSIAFALAWTVMLVAWILGDLPLGPQAPLYYVPASGG